MDLGGRHRGGSSSLSHLPQGTRCLHDLESDLTHALPGHGTSRGLSTHLAMQWGSPAYLCDPPSLQILGPSVQKLFPYALI